MSNLYDWPLNFSGSGREGFGLVFGLEVGFEEIGSHCAVAGPRPVALQWLFE